MSGVRNTPPASSGLLISLVVPLRNEEQTLDALVDSIRRQTRPPDEIILVDGGSTDRTPVLARQLVSDDARFRIVEAGNATPGRGRNVGVSLARYPWIAFTDAGIRLDPTWLAYLVEIAEGDATTEVVYGNYEPLTDTFFERCAAIVYVAPSKRMSHSTETMRGPFIASSLMRREVWQRIGGFPDARAAEDLIFMERIEAEGIKTSWAPSANVRWQLQPTLAGTFRRFVLYSKHNVWVGRQRFWHYGVARHYVLALLFVVLALIHSPWWLVFLALGLTVRAAKSIVSHRHGRGPAWLINPIQFLYVIVIILTIDLATFVGWAQAFTSKPHPNDDAHAELTGEIDK
jgi:glycosyltransferase involved in cell wall biosynthesis